MLLFGVWAATATAANVPVYGAYNYGQNGQYVINGQATNVRYVDRYVEPEPEKVITYVDRYIEEGLSWDFWTDTSQMDFARRGSSKLTNNYGSTRFLTVFILFLDRRSVVKK